MNADQLSAQIETTGLDGLTILASVSGSETHAALSVAFNEINGINFEFSKLGLVPVAAVKTAARTPDVMFFEARDAEQAENWTEAVRANPGGYKRRLVVMIPAPTNASSARLLQVGADDVLTTRPSFDDISRTLGRTTNVSHEIAAPQVAGPTDDIDTRMLMFIHAAGGAGATTLAVNAAVQLHNRVKDRHGGGCLIDLDFQFGDAHLQLDLPIQSRVLDLVNAPERLDRRMLDDLMINAPSGLKVLTSPEASIPLDGVGPETIDTILSLARRRYRYVVVDMPYALTHWTETAMRRADHIFLVTQINVPGLRSARRLLDTIREEGVTRSPITIVANRYGGKTGSTRIPLQQASRALDRDIAFAIPNDYQLVMESLDQGVPVSALKAGSKFAQSITEMLDATVGVKPKSAKAPGLVASLAKLGRK